MNSLREIIRWTWLIVSIANLCASALAWVELRQPSSRTFLYLSRVMAADGFRAAVSVAGLYLFGVNVQAHLWFIIAGLLVAIAQAGAITGWLLYTRGLINGGGLWGLILNTAKRRAQMRSLTKVYVIDDEDDDEDGPIAPGQTQGSGGEPPPPPPPPDEGGPK